MIDLRKPEKTFRFEERGGYPGTYVYWCKKHGGHCFVTHDMVELDKDNNTVIKICGGVVQVVNRKIIVP